MEEKPKIYQTPKPGKPKSNYRNVRFDQETYDNVRNLGKQLGWSFSRVVGEAVEWYLGLTPILQATEEKSVLLAGKPLVIGHVRDYLQRLDADLEEALVELTVSISPTKE